MPSEPLSCRPTDSKEPSPLDRSSPWITAALQRLARMVGPYPHLPLRGQRRGHRQGDPRLLHRLPERRGTRASGLRGATPPDAQHGHRPRAVQRPVRAGRRPPHAPHPKPEAARYPPRGLCSARACPLAPKSAPLRHPLLQTPRLPPQNSSKPLQNPPPAGLRKWLSRPSTTGLATSAVGRTRRDPVKARGHQGGEQAARRHAPDLEGAAHLPRLDLRRDQKEAAARDAPGCPQPGERQVLRLEAGAKSGGAVLRRAHRRQARPGTTPPSSTSTGAAGDTTPAST